MASPRQEHTQTFFSLMRHGPTDWNAQKRIQGQTQTELSAQGRRAALAWGRVLRAKAAHETAHGPGHGPGFDASFRAAFGPLSALACSRLTRAEQTAELINASLELPLERINGLAEQDWGQWTGQSIRDVRADHGPEVARQEALGWNFQPPDGESRTQVLARAHQALCDLASRHPGGHVLVITHQGVLKCLLYHVLNMKFLPREGDPLQPDTVHTIAHQAHLPGNGQAKADPGEDHTIEGPAPGRFTLAALNQDILRA
jgi:broad specificity phosphatase PhoE